MFRRNLLKRVLPIVLSLAMTFQSVPMTALAVEDSQAVVSTEDTEPVTDPEVEPVTDDSSGNEPDQESNLEEGTTADPDEGSTVENTENADVKSETGTETETNKETTGTETGTNAETDTTPSAQDAQGAFPATVITVDDNSLYLGGGFARVNGESRLTYTTSYREDDQFGRVIESVKSAARITVNGESANGLKNDYLILTWKEVQKAEDGTETLAAMTGTPQNVGSYALSLTVRDQEGVCGGAEAKNVYFNITPKELTVSLSNTAAKAGSKIADYKEAVKCTLRDGAPEFTTLKYTFAVKVYEIKDDTEAETEDILFNQNKDYRAKVEIAFADADAAKNYEVTGGEYLIDLGDLLETKVEVRNPGKEMAETYDKATTYTASAMAEKYEVTAEVKVAVEGKSDQWESLGADVTATPKWYVKEINKSGSNGSGYIVDFPTNVDGITQFYGNDNKELYTLMTEESVGEVGEYYLVFTYDGVEGQYTNSHSDPLKVTIDPIEVILKPAAGFELKTEMTNLALKKALAEVEAKLYTPDATDPTLASATASDAPIADKDFYGVSYDDDNATQYYSPVFTLVRQKRTKLAENKWPANATEDQKWTEWASDSFALGDDSAKADLKVNDDETEYKYYVKFTGQKAVYTAGGTRTSERPITEATDAANRNYKVKTDSATLGNVNNMLEVELTKAEETSIDVTKIIEEFKSNRGKDGDGTGLTADDPAWTIYDPDNGLFADKASYKKAIVTSTIKDLHKDITYTWQRSYNVDDYYELTRMQKEENETDEDFAERKKEEVEALEATFSSSLDTMYSIPQDAGLYRLHITYKDSSLVPANAPAEKDVYFLIKKQELIFVADMQYANYDDDVDDFTPQNNSYEVYALPDNDESKIDWEKPLGWRTSNVTWQAKNLKKNADGSDSDVWEDSTGTFIKNEAHPYKYKAAVWLNDSAYGAIYDSDDNEVTNKAGDLLDWSNYTTRNMADWDADNNAYRQRYKVGDGFGDINFDAAEIKVVVDRSKLFDDKTYDGKPIADELPEGFVTLTDANGTPIPETKLQINGEPQEGVGIVNVAWECDNIVGAVSTGEAIFGGTYTLCASFEGNEEYAPLNWWEPLEDKDGDFEFKINPLKVEIAPILKETATAGDKLSEMLEDWHVEFKAVNPDETVPEDDEWLFTAGKGTRWDACYDYEEEFEGYPILDGDRKFSALYYENNSQRYANNRIRYGKKYDVKFSGYDTLYAQYAYSYELTYKPATLANIDRGDAEVWSTGFYNPRIGETNGSVSVNCEKDAKGTYIIVPREGIPFVYDDDTLLYDTDLITKKKIPHEKNYIAVNIVSPREFTNEITLYNDSFAVKNFVYGNSIKSAGGYVIRTFVSSDDGVYRYFITALFPVELDESGKIVDKEKNFNVTWEEGYTDFFKLDLTYAQVEANLKRAVAPKSLAFNGVQSKMAVGEEQQLDVKITKAQLGDVIRINYRLAGGATSNDYASINPETGLITALATNNKKPVAVNVEAYPVRLAADGKTFEEITGKGVKIAKTKVTITEVTAPVIKKVIPTDSSATVQFTKVDNGYRGELYVVRLANKKDANKWKAANFEDAIKSMKNGQWQDTFAVAPQYFSGTRGYDPELKVCTKTISINDSVPGAYVVYVRNVSAVRTLADGSKVTESAAGTVKVFETTKSQVKALQAYFDVVDPKTKANPVRYSNGYSAADGYTVELADKSAQLLVRGRFLEKALNEAADSESVWYQLSLKVAEKALGRKLTDTYLDPKLSYYVTDNSSSYVSDIFDEKGKLKNPSKYVTINNKGKLTFKGVDENGVVTVYLWVRADNGISARCILTVTARPDTLSTKKVKTMKVGDAIRLADYLEYKQGKAKVPNYWSSNIEITNWEEVENAGFWVYRYGSDAQADAVIRRSIDGTPNTGEYFIVAKKSGATCNLKLKDWLWKSGSDDKVQTEEKIISLSTAKLDPVKNLKAVYTDDKHITVNFAHAGHPEAFDIEVKDARGSVVYKRLACRNEFMGTVSATEAAWMQNKQRATLDGLTYFEKTKTYAYTISTEKLMRLSSYTISVTPVYDGERAAKPANTKAKTTNIPASYANGDIVNPDNMFTGISLSFNNSNRAYLISGNTYTLETSVNGGLAQKRGTDTLIWKSSNAKVASVKANQGSYSATLKAMQQGQATITVTSKVTNRTIARYHIAVKAVGKGNGYGGDYENGNGYNEFYDEFIKTVDPYYEGRMEVLTVSNSVTVTDEDFMVNASRDRTWVQFTAPSYGEYTFSCKYVNSSNDKSYAIYYTNGTEVNSSSSAGNKTLRLEEGQTIYFKITDTFTLSVSGYTDFTKLTGSFTKDKPLEVGAKDAWISFTATEDNYYTFKTVRGTIQAYESDGQQTMVNNDYLELGMKAGQTVFIKAAANTKLYVTKREFIAGQNLVANNATGVSMSFTKDNKDDTQYVKFSADVTGEYTFTYKPSDKVNVKFLTVNGAAEYADGDAVLVAKVRAMEDPETPAAPAAPEEAKSTLFMEGGETIVIAVSVKTDQEFADDTKIDVTITAANPGVKPLANDLTVTKGTSQMFEYTIPDDKAATKYTVAASEGATITWYYSKTQKDINGYDSNALAEIYEISNNNNSFTVEDGKVVEPNLTGNRSLNAGDKIYIKVEAAAAADSKITLTRVVDSKTFDASTPAGVVLGAKDGDAEWYTLTLKKTGYYEFSKKVTVAPAEGSTQQDVEVRLVDKAFSDNYGYIDGNSIDLSSAETSGVVKLNAGDYVFKIAATSDAVGEAKTTVTLSVKEIVPTAIAKGDTPVSLAVGEAKYYTFKATTNDKYTIEWTPDADTGVADAKYNTRDLTSNYINNLPANVTSSANTYYIKVAATGDKPVSGKLQVSTEEQNFLTSGKETEFVFTKDGSKDYKFTLPEDSKLGYVVIVENTSNVPEGKEMPLITVTSDSNDNIVSNLPKGKVAEEKTSFSWQSAFTTKTITITASNVTEAAGTEPGVSATGKITIKPVTVQKLVETAFKVKKGDEPKWYTYDIPADGRYMFDYTVGAEQVKSSVQVTWYKKNTDGSRGSQVSTKAYLKKDQQLYVEVTANNTIADAGVDVTLKPATLPTTPLTLTNGKAEATVTAEMVANGAVYYTFKAPAYASYAVTKDDSVVSDIKKYRPNKNGYDITWTSGWTLEKDEEILITITEAGKLTVTQDAITELTLNKASDEITLKNGETASFVLNIFKDAYYDFAVDSSATDLRFNESGEYTSGKHLVVRLSKEDGDRYEFSISNGGEAEAKLKVTATELTPVTLKLGETSIPVAKDSVSIVEFKVPENYWYTVTCSEKSNLQGDISAGESFYYEDDDLYSVLVYTGEEAASTAKVTIAKVAPAPVNGEKFSISLEANESKWYAYKAAKAGMYTFTAPTGVNLRYYSSLADGSYRTGTIGAGADAEIYIKATNNSDAKVENADVTVSCAEATVLNVGANTLSGTGYTYMTFKALEEGEYSFSASSGSIIYYGESVWQTQESGSSHNIKKNSVVYLRAYSNQEENVIIVKKKTVEYLGHVSVESGQYQWITFTAPYAGD